MAKVGTSKRGGKQWQNYPLELGQDAAYQSYTSRLNELLFLPKQAQGLNTNNNNNERRVIGGLFSYGFAKFRNININRTP